MLTPGTNVPRSNHCTHPDAVWCDCDACRYVVKIAAELKHARSQYRRALAREQVSAINMGHCLPLVRMVRLHALAIESCQKWLGAIVRAKRSLALMGVEV